MKDELKAKRAASKEAHCAFSPLDPDWELTVGIEIHAQLNTDRKLFSTAPTPREGDEPNSCVALFDAAIPGSQPIFQVGALVPAIRAALALQCEIQPSSSFDRKHYFYWDQPAGYQITQYFHPLAKNGSLSIFPHDCPGLDREVVVRIQQIQLEQDTAQTLLGDSLVNLVDLNRVSSPLIEIISQPDIHDPEVAVAFVKKVQQTLKRVNAVVAGMAWGGLRADVNVSVKPRESTLAYSRPGLGQRTEIKNLASFKAVEDSIRAEMSRQIKVIKKGGTVVGETRGWTLGSEETTRLRGKEGEVDYRYMPDADLSPVHLDPALVSHLRNTLPTLPDDLLSKYSSSPYDLSTKDANSLINHEDDTRLEMYSDCYELVQRRLQGSPQQHDVGRAVGNWVLHEYGGLVTTMTESSLVKKTTQKLADVVGYVLLGRITPAVGKKLLKMIIEADDRHVDEMIEADQLWTNFLPEEELQEMAQKLFADNPDMVDQMRRKQDYKKLMWFVGQITRIAGRERTDPNATKRVLHRMVFDDWEQDQ